MIIRAAIRTRPSTLIGQLMKVTKGQDNPQVAQKLLNEELEKL